MATEKPAAILRSKSDFSEEEISKMTDSDAWRWIYERDHDQRLAQEFRPAQICFTGFSVSDRSQLEAKAIANNFEVKSSVTSTLRYLCAGPNAGPSKLAKARDQGVAIFSSEQFRAFCETGEFPD